MAKRSKRALRTNARNGQRVLGKSSKSSKSTRYHHRGTTASTTERSKGQQSGLSPFDSRGGKSNTVARLAMHGRTTGSTAVAADAGGRRLRHDGHMFLGAAAPAVGSTAATRGVSNRQRAFMLDEAPVLQSAPSVLPAVSEVDPFVDDGPKTKAQVMAEVIAKSKLGRAQRAAAADALDDLRDSLDADYAEIALLLQPRTKPTAAADGADEESGRDGHTETRASFDATLSRLRGSQAPRARASVRLLPPDEQAAADKASLAALDAERQRRKADVAAGTVGTNAAPRRPGKASDDFRSTIDRSKVPLVFAPTDGEEFGMEPDFAGPAEEEEEEVMALALALALFHLLLLVLLLVLRLLRLLLLVLRLALHRRRPRRLVLPVLRLLHPLLALLALRHRLACPALVHPSLSGLLVPRLVAR
mmetsp:Transcript_15767/g.49379  ORF Transcript_15767/g.49379 Transcript_15767/m.49379 type:complete len:418 (-) Transcript_15767:1305-2558(-)